MRLERLDLIRFGHFTGQSLHFRQHEQAQPLVHVLCASNEAGKTTALHAIRDLLFGIPERKGFRTFRHDTDLLLGALLRTDEGSALEIQRRRGRKNTLLDEHGKPLAEAVLLALLSGVDRPLYETFFALDHASLRSGGDKLATGEGDAADALFASASGLEGLPELVRDLLRRAEDLFGPGNKGRLRPAIRSLLEHTRELNRAQSVVSTGAFHKLLEAVRAADERHERARSALANHRTQIKRLERIRHTVPPLARLTEIEEELRSLDGLPELSEGTPLRFEELQILRRKAQDRLGQLEDTLQRTGDELLRLELPLGLLDAELDIDRLVRRFGAARKAREDLPRRKEELRKNRETLRDLCRQLGWPAADEDPAALVARLPPEPARSGVGETVAEFRKLDVRRDQAREALLETRRRLDEIGNRLTIAAPATDAGALEEIVNRVTSASPSIELRRISTETSAIRAKLESRRLLLVGFGGSLDELAGLDIPSAEEIRHADELRRKNQQGQDQLDGEQAGSERRLREIERNLATFEAGQVPAPERLAEVRSERDRAWAILRRRHLENLPLDARFLGDPLADFDSPQLAGEFERRLRSADGIADDQLSHADEVERRRSLQQEQSTLHDDQARARQTLATLKEEASRLAQKWVERWAPAGVVPIAGPPSVMERWVREQNQIVLGLADVVEAEARQTDLARRVIGWTRELGDLLGRIGLANALTIPPDPADAIDVVLAAARRCLDEKRDLATTHRLLLKDQTTFHTEERLRAQGLEEAERALASAAIKRAQAMERLGCAADATAAEADTILDLFDKLARTLQSLEQAAERVGSIEADIADFENEARRVAEHADPGLVASQGAAPGDGFALTEQLEHALKAARDLRTRRKLRSKDAGEQQGELERERSGLADLDREQTRLRTTLGADDDAAAQRILSQIATAAGLQTRRLELENEIRLHAPGLGLDTVREEAADQHPDAVAIKLADLESLTAILEAEQETCLATRTRAEHDYRALESTTDTADQAAAVDRSRTTAARGAAEWLELQTTALLLQGALEAECQRNQPEQLKRAAWFLGQLTLGHYIGLVPETDASNTRRLLARTKEGLPQGLDQLSDGTRDQLFFALRLAAIEDHVARGVRVPVVADDLLVHFDDERGRAALACLGELSKTTQVIVFTHHRHVADAAKEVLGDALDLVTLAGDAALPRSASG